MLVRPFIYPFSGLTFICVSLRIGGVICNYSYFITGFGGMSVGFVCFHANDHHYSHYTTATTSDDSSDS